MKFLVAAALVLSLFSFVLPAAVYSGGEPEAETEKHDTQVQKEIEQDKSVSVSVLDNGQTLIMDLEEYITGVVAGEMPADFELEALKAQAVAARTYTLYKMNVQPSENHEQDVCTDVQCCKAYASDEQLREKWGQDYDENLKKITQAVNDTKGEYLEYENEPILAVFHSSSAGQTENSADVWQSELPYLQSVASPENSDEVTNYIVDVTVNKNDFISTVQSVYPQAVFAEDSSQWIGSAEYTSSGRVANINVGGAVISGTQMRQLFQLRSTAFTVKVEGEDVIFETTGYGHGVGMSQYGANTMAKNGSTYEEILTWYYTGTHLAHL